MNDPELERYDALLSQLAAFLGPVVRRIIEDGEDTSVTYEQRRDGLAELGRLLALGVEKAYVHRIKTAPVPSKPTVRNTNVPVEGALVVYDRRGMDRPQTVTADGKQYMLVPGPCYLPADLTDTRELEHLVSLGLVTVHAPGSAVPAITPEDRRARRLALMAWHIEPDEHACEVEGAPQALPPGVYELPQAAVPKALLRK